MENRIFEKIPARKYYGNHATGTVFLVNGQPHHYIDRTEANNFEKILLLNKYEKLPELNIDNDNKKTRKP